MISFLSSPSSSKPTPNVPKRILRQRNTSPPLVLPDKASDLQKLTDENYRKNRRQVPAPPVVTAPGELPPPPCRLIRTKRDPLAGPISDIEKMICGDVFPQPATLPPPPATTAPGELPPPPCRLIRTKRDPLAGPISDIKKEICGNPLPPPATLPPPTLSPPRRATTVKFGVNEEYSPPKRYRPYPVPVMTLRNGKTVARAPPISEIERAVPSSSTLPRLSVTTATAPGDRPPPSRRSIKAKRDPPTSEIERASTVRTKRDFQTGPNSDVEMVRENEGRKRARIVTKMEICRNDATLLPASVPSSLGYQEDEPNMTLRSGRKVAYTKARQRNSFTDAGLRPSTAEARSSTKRRRDEDEEDESGNEKRPAARRRL